MSKIDTKIHIYDRKNKSFYTGLLPKVKTFLTGEKHTVSIKKTIRPIEPITYTPSSNTRDYQVNMVNKALDLKRCILKAAAGAGKTWVAGEFLNCFPSEKCLFIVPPNLKLGLQSQAELFKFLNEEIGFVGDGKKNIQRVTVGLSSSLASLEKTDKAYLKSITVMVIDECHKFGGKQAKAISKCCTNADYRVGLSATPKRSDGSTDVMIGLIGPIVDKVSEVRMAKEKNIVSPTYIQIKVKDPNYIYENSQVDRHNKITYKTPTGKPDNQEVYKQALADNPYRNNLICEAAKLFLDNNFKFPGLIMVESISQGEELLQLLLPYYPEVDFIQGDSNSSFKNDVLIDIQTGTRKLTIVSRILNEGINVTSIGFIILACGGSSENRLIQQIGRGARKHPGKDKTYLIDFNDQEKFYLNNSSNKRSQIVKSTYNVNTIYINSVTDLPKYIEF